LVGFSRLRLFALRTEHGLFARSWAEESTLPDDAWRDLLGAPERAVFGLFDGAVLIGITGVVPSRDDPSVKTAMLVMSYLLPAYRGRDLSRMFYEARLGWIAEQPQFERVTVFHRSSNVPSRHAIVRFGFVETERIATTWPDGMVEDEVRYELPPIRDG
jgi:RimJ/RimL family protein N-acetyltransferase